MVQVIEARRSALGTRVKLLLNPEEGEEVKREYVEYRFGADIPLVRVIQEIRLSVAQKILQRLPEVLAGGGIREGAEF